MHRIDCPIVLLDADMRRRASISHRLGRIGVHVEPFETVGELIAHWPSSGIILAHDAPDIVASLIHHMGRHGEWLPLVMFDENPTPAQIVAAVFEGAVNFVAWPIDDTVMGDALVAARERADAMSSDKLRSAHAKSRIARLTPREREVLTGVADGLSNRLIGAKLGISPRTVEIHRANMANKMGTTHTSEAIRIAIEADLGASTTP